MEILLAAALLPAFGLMYYVYQQDKVEKEPFGLIVRVFVLGAVAGIVAAFVESFLMEVFESSLPGGTALLILEYFVGVAMVEEALKYAALATVIKNPAFNYVFDGIVYAVAAALGFAALENVFYVLEGGMGVAVMRALFSVPGHCADGVVMGCFVGLARHRSVRGQKPAALSFYLLAFVLPVIEHGIYDTALSTDSDAMIVLALAVEVVFIVIGAVLVNRMSKNDQPIYPGQQFPVQQVAQQVNQQVLYQQYLQNQQYQQPGMQQQYQQYQQYQQPGMQQQYQQYQQPGMQPQYQQPIQQPQYQQQPVYQQPAAQPQYQQYPQYQQPQPQYQQPPQQQ